MSVVVRLDVAAADLAGAEGRMLPDCGDVHGVYLLCCSGSPNCHGVRMLRTVLIHLVWCWQRVECLHLYEVVMACPASLQCRVLLSHRTCKLRSLLCSSSIRRAGAMLPQGVQLVPLETSEVGEHVNFTCFEERRCGVVWCSLGSVGAGGMCVVVKWGRCGWGGGGRG